MSKWRAKALALFPDIRPAIESADSLGYFWIELMSRYGASGDPEPTGKNQFRHSVYMYAAWCDSSPDWRTRETAGIEFFQSIVPLAIRCGKTGYAKVVEELVEFFGFSTIKQNAQGFGFRLSREQLESFLKDAEAAANRQGKRSSKKHL